MKIALIAASKDFRDEEYFIPYRIFKEQGAEICVFSDKKGDIIGLNGGEGKANKELKEFQSYEFSAVVFIGGPGAMKLLDNEESYRIARETKKEGALLTAICISPLILAKAGVLQGVRATVWHSPLDKAPVKLLEKEGALYEESDVLQDGNIITANGPKAAESFARKIMDTLRAIA